MFFNTQSNHYKNDTKGYSQTILNKSRWNLKKYPYNPTVKQEKNSPGMSAKRNKEKANKIADWNSDISVIILNVNALNTAIKSQIGRMDTKE